jgi:hypothetical protein
MDDIDLQVQRDEALMAAAIAVRKPVGPAPTGCCLWCEEGLSNSTDRWCDADCRDDYERAALNAPHLIP